MYGTADRNLRLIRAAFDVRISARDDNHAQVLLPRRRQRRDGIALRLGGKFDEPLLAKFGEGGA